MNRLERLARLLDPLGWTVRDEVRRLRAENRRLRALIEAHRTQYADPDCIACAIHEAEEDGE